MTAPIAMLKYVLEEFVMSMQPLASSGRQPHIAWTINSRIIKSYNHFRLYMLSILDWVSYLLCSGLVWQRQRGTHVNRRLIRQPTSSVVVLLLVIACY